MAGKELLITTAHASDQSPSQWRAMIVDQVDENRVLEGYGGVEQVPTCLIRFPFQSLDDVAILSWRWDGDLNSRGSMNIACAVHQAKRMRVKYLLLDVVSINQSLPSVNLITHVLAFAELYTWVPVIAAYDSVGERTIQSLTRPWIVFEARKYRYNPKEITHVGHNDDGGVTRRHTGDHGNLLFTALRWTSSENVWLNTIHEVLIGLVGMTDVSDLKYIIPTAYQDIIVAAYAAMTRNDYLLTLLLLWGINNRAESIPTMDLTISNFTTLTYSRYRISRQGGSKGRNFIHDIFLDRVLVACARRKEGWYEIETNEALHGAVFAAIGLHFPEHEHYSIKTDMKLAWRGPPRKPSDHVSRRQPAPVVAFRLQRIDSVWHSECVALENGSSFS